MATPIRSTAFRDIIMRGLRTTPEERAEANQRARAPLAETAAAERGRYDAMSEAERDEYDALTDGMMPRLPGVAERQAERSYRAKLRRGCL